MRYGGRFPNWSTGSFSAARSLTTFGIYAAGVAYPGREAIGGQVGLPRRRQVDGLDPARGGQDLGSSILAQGVRRNALQLDVDLELQRHRVRLARRVHDRRTGKVPTTGTADAPRILSRVSRERQ